MLPLEILDHILSYLDTDHVALKTCLRAHPVFSDLVKRYLYVHIVVLNEPTVNSHSLKPAQLAKLLLTNVCVADHVRSLHMTVLTLGNNQWQEMGWILPKFRQLEGISLTVAAQGAWSSVHKDVREAFMNCLRLPSTVEVSILRAHGFSLCAFADCGLKKLTLNENFNPSSRTLSLPYLESLSIHKGWPCLSEFFSSANIPKLRSLDFRPYRPNDFGSLPQLLQHCSNTLTSLELDFGINCMYHRDCWFILNTKIIQFKLHEIPTHPIHFRSLCLAFRIWNGLFYMQMQLLMPSLKWIIPFRSLQHSPVLLLSSNT